MILAALSGAAVLPVLANSTKACYTYDALGKVTSRTIKQLSDGSVISTEEFTYDAAGNITDAPDSCFQYDTNNRLVVFNGNAVSYDLDGNMLNNGVNSYTYDSANRLISAGGHNYTYNAENIRIRNLCETEDTTYTYDTNCKLSKLLMKTTCGVVTKYVYGRGLIGEESSGAFKTYHFDCRGSTIAITDISGNVTDTFAYDTYGKLISRTGDSDVIFSYNGRHGVITDANGLIYMRARYYSPEMKRFINPDIIVGKFSAAVTLNRFAYANDNPVSFIDPFGLSAERGTYDNAWEEFCSVMGFDEEALLSEIEGITVTDATTTLIINDDALAALHASFKDIIKTSSRPKGMGKREWERLVKEASKQVDDLYGPASKLAKGLKALPYVTVGIDSIFGIVENVQNGEDLEEIVTDATLDVSFGVATTFLSSVAASAATGAVAGSVAPGVGNLIGMGAGIAVGALSYVATEVVEIKGKSVVEWADEGIDWVIDGISSWFD